MTFAEVSAKLESVKLVGDAEQDIPTREKEKKGLETRNPSEKFVELFLSAVKKRRE